jgi:AraC-like DNA-binding protein
MEEPAAKPSPASGLRVIPDTCMDIIFNVDCPTGRVGAFFSGIQERSFAAGQGERPPGTETFAIRFYAWAAGLFADEYMSGALAGYGQTERYFPGLEKNLAGGLGRLRGLEERAAAAERVLAAKLDGMRSQPAPLLNGLYKMIKDTGRTSVEEAAAYACIGQRQFERLFKQWTGLSPKKMSDLIRYQSLWRDLVSGRMQPQDAVMRYGFADQAHMVNSFRQYHGTSPGRAVELAWADRRMSGFCNTNDCQDGSMGESR